MGNENKENEVVENESVEENEETESAEKNEKTFTQEQVNKMMAKEKKQGMNSVYKEFGIKPGDKKSIDKIKEYLESQKTDTEKQAEIISTNQLALEEANQKVLLAETKAEAMQLGVQPQFVDDVVTLAINKIKNEEGAEITTVIGELKTKYPSWFNISSDEKEKNENVGEKGTGSSVKSNHSLDDKQKNLGARLAGQKKSSQHKSYWSK